MQPITLTPEEIKTVKTAINFVYNSKIEYLGKNRAIISNEEKAELLKTANSFDDLILKFK